MLIADRPPLATRCRPLWTGATAALELGPGNALAQMVTGAMRDVRARALDDFRTLAGVRSWLARALER